MTQKKEKTLHRIVCAVPLLLTFAFIAIRIISIKKYYDSSVGFYQDGVLLPKLLNYGLIAAALLMSIAYFIPSVLNMQKRRTPPTSFVVFASAFTGFIFFGYILAGLLPLFNFRHSYPDPALIEIATIILALPASIHFFAKTTQDGKKGDLRAILGLAPVVWCLVYVFVLYFDRFVLINNPHKILTQMTFISAALFFLFEARFPLGQPKAGSYLVFASITQILSGTSSIPNILYFFTNGKTISEYTSAQYAITDIMRTFTKGSPLVHGIIFDFIVFGIFLYTTARLLSPPAK